MYKINKKPNKHQKQNQNNNNYINNEYSKLEIFNKIFHYYNNKKI